MGNCASASVLRTPSPNSVSAVTSPSGHLEGPGPHKILCTVENMDSGICLEASLSPVQATCAPFGCQLDEIGTLLTPVLPHDANHQDIRHEVAPWNSVQPGSQIVHSSLCPVSSCPGPNRSQVEGTVHGATALEAASAPSHPCAARSYLQALLSAAPASIETTHGRKLCRARSLPPPHTQCFKCLATDHLVAACRDPVRCRKCLCYGHRSFRARQAHRPSPRCRQPPHVRLGSLPPSTDVWSAAAHLHLPHLLVGAGAPILLPAGMESGVFMPFMSLVATHPLRTAITSRVGATVHACSRRRLPALPPLVASQTLREDPAAGPWVCCASCDLRGWSDHFLPMRFVPDRRAKGHDPGPADVGPRADSFTTSGASSAAQRLGG